MKAFYSSPKNDNNGAYDYLKESFKETNDPTIRRQIIDSIGNFKKIDSSDFLKGIIQDEKVDPYERYSAAIAISGTGHEESIPLLKNSTNITSFHNLVARGSIEGLKIIAINSKDISDDIVDFIIEKTKDTNYHSEVQRIQDLGENYQI